MSLTQRQRVGLTVAAILLGIAVIVSGFVHRIQQPRIMTVSEMRANGLFIFDTPRDPGEFELINHHGQPFTEESLEGDWALLFFGFTYSGVMSAILVCTRMMVSANYAARAMSITSFFGWFGMGAGGFMGGYLFDLTGSYDTSFIAAMVVGCINLGILILFAVRIRNASRLSIATHS